MDQAKITYGDIEIVYDEEKNRWRFTLDGRERSAEMLTNAKKAIDAPERKTKKAFEPIQAWIIRVWGGGRQLVTITSVAERVRYSRGTEVWVKKGGKREKVSLGSLYADTPQNFATFAEIDALEKEIEALQKKRNHKYAGLKRVTIPGEDE